MRFDGWNRRRAAGMALLLVSFFFLLSFRADGASQQRRASRERRYAFAGVVKSVDKPARRATIQHEKVEGLMDAMTMPFLIKDDKALQQLAPGDQIRATLVATSEGGQWLEQVVITARGQAPAKEDKPSFLMGASGNDRQPPPSRFDSDANDLYTCPMHLNYRAAKPGKCPRCGMDLISVEPSISEEFELKMEATPKAPRPGQPVTLRFAIFNPRTGAKVKAFGLMHDRLFHVFVVSQDLADFQHLHPRQLPDGSFKMDVMLHRTGLYRIYTDFYPLDGAPQVLQTYLATEGWRGDIVGGQAHLTPDASLAKIVRGARVDPAEADKLGVSLPALEKADAPEMKVELAFDRTPIIGGQKVTLKFRLTDPNSGEPVRDLIPYLGAWGHMLILSEDQTRVLHSHPEETIDFEQNADRQRGGPSLSFDVLFPAAGVYRVWTQFLRGRQVYMAVFDLRVEMLQ